MFKSNHHRLLRHWATLGAMTALSCVVSACGGESNRVNVGPGSMTAIAEGVPPKIAFINPATGAELPQEIFSKVGEDVLLSLQIRGVEASQFAVGYRQTNGLSGVQVDASTLRIPRPAVGTYRVEIVARQMESCQKLHHQNCQIQGQPVYDEQVYDLRGSVVLNIVDPTQAVNSSSEGGGLIGKVIRGEGLIGALAQMFMGNGGLLGGVGGGQTQPLQ